MKDLWDGRIDVYPGVFQTIPGTSFPQWFTFDMGVKARLDRFIVYSRPSHVYGAYTAADPRVIILWGSNDPNPDGAFDSSWHKLGKFVAIKPSGLPPGQATAEDYTFAVIKGRHFRIPDAAQKPAVRYIRFETVDTFTPNHGNGINFEEFTFFGQIIKKSNN